MPLVTNIASNLPRRHASTDYLDHRCLALSYLAPNFRYGLLFYPLLSLIAGVSIDSPVISLGWLVFGLTVLIYVIVLFRKMTHRLHRCICRNKRSTSAQIGA
jgi:hypothetical protein